MVYFRDRVSGRNVTNPLDIVISQIISLFATKKPVSRGLDRYGILCLLRTKTSILTYYRIWISFFDFGVRGTTVSQESNLIDFEKFAVNIE